MTETEWQKLYEITSIKGRIWKRCDIVNRSSALLKKLLSAMPALSKTAQSARRGSLLILLDDPVFMHPRRGMVPARVIEDTAFEAMYRMAREVKP